MAPFTNTTCCVWWPTVGVPRTTFDGVTAGASGDGHPSEPHAWEISVPQTLELLDRNFEDLIGNVADGRFAFWLGSGISFGRMPQLTDLLRHVLSHLQSAATEEARPNRFSAALDEILALAQLSDQESAVIDTNQPVGVWPSLDLVLKRLSSVYAKVMNVRVPDERDDYLLWEAAKVVARFADPTIEPDVEHLCVAILALEGVAPVIVTANWDGLIERACADLCLDDPPLRVCVKPEDVRELKRRASLFKIHGCAVLAAAQPDDYRSRLIVRQSQVDDWLASGGNLREEVVAFARTMPTLMIGLSAQDANIKSVFSVAKNQMAWPWPPPYVAHVFAEDQLGPDQKSILQFTYRDHYEAHGDEIERSALLRAFGKPLLVSLVLEVLAAKLSALGVIATRSMATDDDDVIAEGICALRDLAAEYSVDQLEFVHQLIEELAEAGSMFVGSLARDGGPLPYQPLSTSPRHELVGDPSTAALGRPEAALALALIGLGYKDGEWSVGRRAGAALVLSNAYGEHDLYFAANPGVEVALAQAGFVDEGDCRSIIIQSGAALEALPRSPTAAPGRTGLAGVTTVSISDLLPGAANVRELLGRFRSEAVI